MSTDMTVKQAAKYAGIHYTELIILVRNNVIPSRKFGFQYQVSKSDIDKWINKILWELFMSTGWIKLHRQSLKNGWLQNPILWAFWCYCLLKASHKKHTHFIGFQKVILEPGQFVFGIDQASKDLKLSYQSIRTCLKKLEKYENLTRKVTNKFSIITICNWSIYQNDENDDQQANQQASNKQVTSKQQASNKQVTANKNDKNDNNENNENKKEVKHIHGEFKHVRLTEKEYEKLKTDFNSKLPDMIKNLDEAIEQYGYKYSNHNLTLRKWEAKKKNEIVEKADSGVRPPHVQVIRGCK